MFDPSYDQFHKDTHIQTKTITGSNFTYYNVLKFLNPLLKTGKRLRILDYGCGSGALSFYLAKMGNRVTGVDISKNAISICRNSAKEIGLSKNSSFISTDEWNRLHSSVKYDLVICIEVIEHLNDDLRIIKKLAGLLRKDGFILITTPSIFAPLSRLGILKSFDDRVGHLRRYRASDLIRILSKNGLLISKVEVKEGVLRNFLFTFSLPGKLVKFIRGPISHAVMFTDDILVKIFGGSNIHILAKKM